MTRRYMDEYRIIDTTDKTKGLNNNCFRVKMRTYRQK